MTLQFKKNILSNIALTSIILLLTICISINLILYGYSNYLSEINKNYEDLVNSITRDNDEFEDNTSLIKVGSLRNYNPNTDVKIVRHISSPNDNHFIPSLNQHVFLFLVSFFYFISESSRFISNNWTLINLKVRLND